MRFKHIKGFLSVLFVSLFLLSMFVSFVVGKPLSPNPASPFWPAQTVWGTNLRFENTDGAPPTISEIWWGVGGVSDSTIPPAPDPPAGLIVEFLAPDYDVSGTTYFTWVKAAVAEPASYTWQVQFRKVKAPDPNGGTVSSTMENIDTGFVPQDYSVVLENTDLGIKINFRANPLGLPFPPFTGGDNVKGTNIRLTPILAALNVDNAVNIQSIDNLDPLVGNPGDNLRLRVFVKNTGRYTDNYVVSSLENGILDPTTITNLPPDNTDNVIVTTTLPSGTQNIVITAAGDYATDQDYVTATGVLPFQPIVVQAENTGYGLNAAGGLAPWKVYNVGDNAPVMVAKRIGTGAVVAAGIDSAIQYYRRNGYSGTATPNNAQSIGPYGDNLDVLLDITFQWMKPGATKILWYEGDNVYSAYWHGATGVSTLVAALTAKGYTIDNGNMTTLDNLGLYGSYDILVLNQEEINNSTPSKILGGTPRDLTSSQVAAVTAFEASGKGVFVMETGDYSNNSWVRVANRILDNMGFGWWFQHDSLYDNTRNFSNSTDNNFKPYVVTVSGNPIADNFVSQVGSNEIGFYKVNTMIQRPTLGVSETISPSENRAENGATVTFVVNVKNNDNVFDNFQLTFDNDNSWVTTINPSFLVLNPGDNGSAIMSVTLPGNAFSGSDHINVKAISFWDNSVRDNKIVTATIFVRGVKLSISPSSQDNDNGGTLKYSVSVRNFDNVQENFLLGKGDNAGWTLVLDNTSLLIPPSGGIMATNLTVNIPPSATPGTFDNIWVKATENENALEFDNESCLAHVTLARGVQVVITPPSQENDNGGTLTYTVTVRNFDNVQENFLLGKGDNAGWTLALDNSFLLIPENGGTRTTKLTVTIPTSATPGTSDSIWVKATENENALEFDNQSCLARVTLVRNVQVIIAPSSQENDNGGTLIYTVTVKSLSNILENFQITKGDNAGWTLTLDNTSLLIPIGENRTENLTVTIPASATGGTVDNIWVKATSQDNSSVFDNKSCLANVRILRGVQLVITPSSQENDNGGTLTYTITVNSLSNLPENFQITKGDNAGWTLTLDNTWLLIAKGGTGTTKLTVNIPASATGGNVDNVWVKAASQDNASVFDNKSCLANAKILKGVQVVITPPSQDNDNGGTLTYTVTVNSLSNVQENFQLTKGDNAGWTLALDNSWLSIAKGGTGTTKLTVTIPSSAIPGTFDNIWVKAASQDNASIFDNKSCLAQVTPPRGVQVLITPPSQDNDNGGTLKYDVLVKNLGNVLENFQLTNGDNAGWTLALDNTSLAIPIGENRTTTLTVTIPASATGGTVDNVWVRAISQDNAVFDNKSCLAIAKISRGVQVVITPSSQENDNGGTLTYTVTVNSLSNVVENFQLTRGDNAGWTLTLDNAWLLIAKGGTGTTKLTVAIPGSATPGTFDNIWVKATSQDNTSVFDNESCLARAKPLRGVQVVISPTSQENVNGGTLTYTVTVKNLGNVQENFQLTKGDSAGWTLTLDNTWLVVPDGENRTTNLTVNIPASATGGTIDNIWVKATSKDDNTVFDNKSCLAHAKIVRGVQVVINPTPPNYLENENGGTVKFTVTVVNLGNVLENFLLTRGDNKGWTLTLDNSGLLVPKGGNMVTHLNVTIPTNATDNTFDNIWVKATSKDDNTVFDNKACLAHVKIVTPTPPVVGVSVTISPSEASAAPGKGLSYTVMVTNTGSATDTFDLSISGGTGWSPSISSSSITLAAGAASGATLTVTVPSGASEGASTTITVTATSRADSTVSNSKSCKATATAPGPGPNPTPTGVSWVIILVIAVAIVIIIVILLVIFLL